MASDLNLLWLTENYPPQRGGMAESCDRIVRGLRAAGVEITVAHFAAGYAEFRAAMKRNGRDIACPLEYDAAHTLNRAWLYLSQPSNESIHTHVVAFGGALPILAAPVYAAWLAAPLILMIRGNDCDAGIFSPERASSLREAIRRAARVCAVSRDKVEKIRALFPRAQVSWTPNGINLHDWRLNEHDRARAVDWRRKNVRENRRVIGLFGQLKRKKGGIFFIEQVLRSGHAREFHLLLIGELETEMHALLEANAGELNFTHLPFVERFALLPFYAACDLIAIPSFYDGMPNVLLEAAVLGVPLLASRAGGMADVLIDRENAILFAPGDATNCHDAITRAALASENELRRLGEESRALVVSRFNGETEALRYVEIFKETKRATMTR